MPEPNPNPTPDRPVFSQSWGTTPIPDPTELTSRAVDALRVSLTELFDTKLEGALAVVNQRLDGIDLATELSRQDLPSFVDEKVAHLRQLHDEKFMSIATQFKERDTRSERESRDNKVAVDAAFAAQKEAASEQNKSNTLAIDKSEKATAETLNKQADLFKSTTDAIVGQLNDLKLRVNAIESVRLGGREQVQESRGTVNFGTGLIGFGIAAALGLAALVALNNDSASDPIVVEVPATP